ncbi:hypothetical protein YC2023_108022 [Brassica napus]
MVPESDGLILRILPDGRRILTRLIRWRFGVLKLRITHILQPLILIGKMVVDQFL